MQGFHIWSIAKYEIKTLTRSWFFRIFGIIAITVLFFYNLFLQTDMGGSMRWDLNAIPAGIPYYNLLILNIAQAIIAAFLASDFLRRDKKLDSTEVIYMRSMSNGDYVIGKTFGNLIVFLALNLIVLVMVAVFNLISKTSGMDVSAYFQYLLFLSIPTLIFIMGLSFLLMSLIRNQGITFILLLGYIAVVLFYLKDKLNYLFDYMGYNVPMVKSDFSGFGNFQDVLIHRGLYLFLGLGFISLTIVLLKRLPQSRFANTVSTTLAVTFIAAGLFAGILHINKYFSTQSGKDEMIALNNRYSDRTMVSVSHHDIKLEHQGEKYKAESSMMLVNKDTTEVSEIILTLNPGLKVNSVVVDGRDAGFTRELQILTVNQSLMPGDSLECFISYEGSIDQAFCYLEMNADTRQAASEYYQNSYAFVQDEYVLLTPETKWYPSSGVSYSNTNPGWMHRDFTRFSLEVKDPSPLMAISQGAEKVIAGNTQFSPETPLPFITLIIGNYQRITTRPDSVEFQLAYHPEHNFFLDVFPDLKDTIPSIIATNLQDYERRINLKYPYNRLKVVEVPVQFTSFQHVWAGGFENVQPEIILLPEMGAGLRQANIRGNIKNALRFSRRDDQNLTEKDMQIMALNNFLNLFLNEQVRPNIRPVFGKVRIEERVNRYYIFPQFFNHTHFITSPELPIFNRVLEAYLKSTFSDMRTIMLRQFTGMTANERANMALQEKSFAQLLNDPEQSAIMNNVIQLKGDVLFSNIKALAGKEEFEEFLYAYLEENKFSVTSFRHFESEISTRFNLNLSSFVEEWMNSKQLPGFLFGPILTENVRGDEMIKTMVQFKVSNMEEAPGMIKIVFRLGAPGGRGGFGPGFMGMGGGGGADNVLERFVYLEGNQTKEVSFLLDMPPRAMTINTMTSKNIPMDINNFFRRIELNRRKIPFEGEVIVDDEVSLFLPGEIVVDNEDPGFELIQPENIGLFVRLMDKNEESEDAYSGMSGFRPPENWTLTTNSSFFGKYVRSAYYVRGGDGDRKARWNLPVSDAGYYNLYYYLEQQQMPQMRGSGGRGTQGGPGGGPGGDNQPRDAGQYHFVVYHDEGEQELSFNLNDMEGGWNNLGSFYFSSEKAAVELTNKGTAQRVVADAVKLIKEAE